MFARLCCSSSKKKHYIFEYPVEQDYEILEQVGKGKTGAVYRARDRLTNETVAIKVILQSYLTTETRRTALDLEIDVLSQVRHRAIIELKRVYWGPESIAVVTEVAAGGEVLQLLSSPDSAVSEVEIRRIIRSVASALIYLHSKEIVHRDIKPQNLLFVAPKLGSEIRLIDFGVSHIGSQDKATGMVGTTNYMAPEMFGKASAYGPEVDLWALGVLTYVLVFGCYPFEARFLSQLEDKIVLGKFEFPSELVNDVSDEVKDFISKLLVVDKTKRMLAIQVMEHPWMLPGGARNKPFSKAQITKLAEFYEATKPLGAPAVSQPPTMTSV